MDILKGFLTDCVDLRNTTNVTCQIKYEDICSCQQLKSSPSPSWQSLTTAQYTWAHLARTQSHCYFNETERPSHRFFFVFFSRMLAPAPVCFAITQSEGGRGHSLGVPEQDKVTLTPATLTFTELIDCLEEAKSAFFAFFFFLNLFTFLHISGSFCGFFFIFRCEHIQPRNLFYVADWVANTVGTLIGDSICKCGSDAAVSAIFHKRMSSRLQPWRFSEPEAVLTSGSAVGCVCQGAFKHCTEVSAAFNII